MWRRTVFMIVCILFSVVIFSSCTAIIQESNPSPNVPPSSDPPSSAVFPPISDIMASLTAEELERQQIALAAAGDLANSIIADLQSGKEPVRGELNDGQSPLDAYQLFIDLKTITISDPVFTQAPLNPIEDDHVFRCDVSAESVISGQQFQDEIYLYIKVDPDTYEVMGKDWYTDHIVKVRASNESLKRFLECAVKNDPVGYLKANWDGDGEPSQEQISLCQKNMTYYTQKYDLSSFTIAPVGIASDDSFFIEYDVTDAKERVFTIKTGRGDGMVYLLLPY